jgi:hypothetical protein
MLNEYHTHRLTAWRNACPTRRPEPFQRSINMPTWHARLLNNLDTIPHSLYRQCRKPNGSAQRHWVRRELPVQLSHPSRRQFYAVRRSTEQGTAESESELHSLSVVVLLLPLDTSSSSSSLDGLAIGTALYNKQSLQFALEKLLSFILYCVTRTRASKHYLCCVVLLCKKGGERFGL